MINVKMRNQGFYKIEFHGKINHVSHDIKGFYTIKVEGEEYYLNLFGTCIDKLEPGDSIIKKKESYSLLVKHLSSNEYFEYNCFHK
jgi:hypothetical protein